MSIVTARSFFDLIPRRSSMTFFAAVFFVFAPLGLLVSSSFAQQRPVMAVISMAIISGGIAVSWAATFTVSKWFAVGIISFTAAIIAFNGPLRDAVGMGHGAMSLEGVGSVLSIAAGYALFIAFIAGQGRTTLRLQTEMSLAQQIHETLVPPIAIVADRFEAVGASIASSEMGGDLIDVVEGDETTDFYIADVSGHGVRAGVVMGMVKSAIRTRLRSPGRLGDVLGDLNQVLEQTISDEMFATFAGVRFTGSGSVEVALAGHHPILLFGEDGVDLFDNESLPLGVSRNETFVAREVETRPGDLLVLYTDGLSECTDAQGRQLGHDAIRDVITSHRTGPLEEIRDALLEVVDVHGRPFDDQSLLLIRVGG